MYKVDDLTFPNFTEVIDWAWDTHKISANFDLENMTEEDKQDACLKLQEIIVGE